MTDYVTYTLEFVDNDQAKEFIAWLWAEDNKLIYDIGQDFDNKWLNKLKGLIQACYIQLDMQYEKKVNE